MNDMMKKTILVIGMGEVGRPLLQVLMQGESEAIGIDIEPVSVDTSIDIMHICISFENLAKFQSLVVAFAKRYSPEVIVINSTVVPGTTRAIESDCGIPCVYSPIRGKHTQMADDLYKYVKFVAGADSQAVERVAAHFKAAGLHSETMSTPEALELAKLLETTYFGLLIAWAQEMNRLATDVDADYLEIGRFFREIAYLPAVLFQPGHIGGHCVMPNIELLRQRFNSDFLDAITASNEKRQLELKISEQQSAEKRLQPIALK